MSFASRQVDRVAGRLASQFGEAEGGRKVIFLVGGSSD